MQISDRCHKQRNMNDNYRMPKDFYEFQGEGIMSNYEREINQEIAEAIKGKNMFSRYSGWNFSGLVWWENGEWFCEVFTYGFFQETFVGDTLQEIMDLVSNSYGYD